MQGGKPAFNPGKATVKGKSGASYPKESKPIVKGVKTPPKSSV